MRRECPGKRCIACRVWRAASKNNSERAPSCGYTHDQNKIAYKAAQIVQEYRKILAVSTARELARCR